jgi:hypothetical protein
VDFLRQRFETQYPLLNFLVGEDVRMTPGGDAAGHSLTAALQDAFVGKLCVVYHSKDHSKDMPTPAHTGTFNMCGSVVIHATCLTMLLSSAVLVNQLFSRVCCIPLVPQRLPCGCAVSQCCIIRQTAINRCPANCYMACLTGGCAVGVLVLSMEFISSPLRMAELHLLLKRGRQGSTSFTKLQLVPVFYDVTRLEVTEKAEEYSAARSDKMKQQWAKDLRELLTINIIAQDQVQS